MRQDGNLNFVAQSGCVLRNIQSNDDCFLVLNNQTWAILVWPVQVHDSEENGFQFGHMTLDTSDRVGVQWRFIYNPSDFEVPFTADGIRIVVLICRSVAPPRLWFTGWFWQGLRRFRFWIWKTWGCTWIFLCLIWNRDLMFYQKLPTSWAQMSM